MAVKKVKTYMDKLMQNKNFKKEFEREYSDLLISESIAKLRKSARLTQESLAEKIHTTKSAISRYESADYHGYSIALLKKIANACGADIELKFVHRNFRDTTS
ncbi:MAG: helix-turn-helix transcriptional regulator [Candidatus Omnitrophota bacterium]